VKGTRGQRELRVAAAVAPGGKCRETGYDRRSQSAVKWKPGLRHVINIWRELSAGALRL
jgi:hypothetical protein